MLQAQFVFDSCSLINFVTVEAIGLLSGPFKGRAYIARAAEDELTAGTVLGRPDCITYKGLRWIERCEPEGAAELREFAIVHRLLGTARNHGEAQSIAVCRQRSWRFISDDDDALSVAESRGVQVLTTTDILSMLVASGRLPAGRAADLAGDMERAGRPVRADDLQA